MTDRKPTAHTPPAASTVAEVVKATRAAAGMGLREFAALLGNVSHEFVRQIEAGAQEPGKDVLAEWFTHSDERIVEMTRQIFIVRSWAYLRQRHRDAYALPTFMTTAA